MILSQFNSIDYNFSYIYIYIYIYFMNNMNISDINNTFIDKIKNLCNLVIYIHPISDFFFFKNPNQRYNYTKLI